MSSLPIELRALSAEQKQLYRRRMEADPWYFSKYICGHGTRAIERVHRPLLYLITRQAPLLAATLADERFDGYLTDQIRADLRSCGINWLDPAHLPRLARRLRRVNVRMPRGAGKSTFADDADLWDATVDPNITISIGSKADDYAEARIMAMGEVVKSPQYAFWFPDRVPTDMRNHVTSNYILLAGRTTVGEPEGTIEGRGITSQWSGRHYRKNRRDDIVGTESKEASLDDALKHMADMSGLRHAFDWRGDVFIGVVTGENDDHAQLADDPDVLTVAMPAEIHNGGTTVENVFEDGILTMPEWEKFSRDGLREIKNEAKKNPEHGPIYLLQNFYMTAHKSGVSLFTRRLLNSSLYRILRDDVSEVILRPKAGNFELCYAQWPDSRGKPKPRKFNMDDWFVLDTKTLPSSAFGIAADQSVSKSGDEWALGAVCEDWEGVFYLLDVVKGRGYGSFIDTLPQFDRRFGAQAKIGIDANATQGMTIEWLKRGEQYRDLARRVFPIRSGGEAKDVNIRNYVQSRMLSHLLFINPELDEYHGEMIRYRPRTEDGRKRRYSVDNQLDVTWMAMTLPLPPLSPEDEETAQTDALLRSFGQKSSSIAGNWTDANEWDVTV